MHAESKFTILYPAHLRATIEILYKPQSRIWENVPEKSYREHLLRIPIFFRVHPTENIGCTSAQITPKEYGKQVSLFIKRAVLTKTV